MTIHHSTSSDRDHAVTMYLAGKTIKQAAAEAGINPKTLTRELHSRGIETTRRGTWRELPHSEVAARYLTGESELALASAYIAQRGAIRRSLHYSGIDSRGRSDAGIVRAAKMTAEERAAQAKAANIAATGRKATWEERCIRAQTIERNPRPLSGHEQQFAHWLDGRQISYRREVAVGIYNVDFTVGSIAVEILGGEWHAYKTGHATRTPHILDQGWNLLFIWATINCPMTDATADYTITLMDELRRNPTSIREYRVIRGDGYLLARGSRDSEEFSGIIPSRSCLDDITTKSWIGKRANDIRNGCVPYYTPRMYRK